MPITIKFDLYNFLGTFALNKLNTLILRMNKTQKNKEAESLNKAGTI